MKYLLTVLLCVAGLLNAQSVSEEQEKESLRKLHLISDLLIIHTGSNGDKFPDKPGAAGLQLIAEGLKPADLIAPFDTKSLAAGEGEALTEKNTSYAYLGNGLSNGKGYVGGRITTPVIIEKPWLRNDGKVAVMDLGGRLTIRKLEVKNCLEAVYKLRENNYPDDPYWSTLIKNAKELDKANGVKYN